MLPRTSNEDHAMKRATLVLLVTLICASAPMAVMQALPLRETVTLPNGNLIDARSDYANVQLPAGVK